MMNLRAIESAPINLNNPGDYLHWGVISISVTNLVVIGLMLAVFALAILVPFPKGRKPR